MTTITDLETPAVTVHLDMMEDNIRRVQAHLDRHRIANRPHIKTHKIPAIGKMQMAAGAVGITCQKLGEVEVFADAGVADDVLLTYNILGPAKTERLMALARRVPRLAVVLDNDVVARELSEAARRAQRDLPFLIECDTGFRRTGVQTPDEALRPRATGPGAPRPPVQGSDDVPEPRPGHPRVLRAGARPCSSARASRCAVVSGGGTPALATVDRFPMLTEHRAGTCVYNDAMVVASGTATWDQCAMRVRATVVSRPTDDRGVLDAGSKVLTSDLYHMKGYGHVMEYPEAQVTHLSEEHAVVDLSGCAERPKVGDVVQRGAEPLLRGHQHGRRGLRRAEWSRRGGVAGRGARPGALRPPRAPMARTGAHLVVEALEAAGDPSPLLALRQPHPVALRRHPREPPPLHPAHASRGGRRAHGGRVGPAHRRARGGPRHRGARPLQRGLRALHRADGRVARWCC